MTGARHTTSTGPGSLRTKPEKSERRGIASKEAREMNNLFSVWQSVKVTDKDHARHGQTGTVWANAPQGADTVTVKFDLNDSGSVEDVPAAAVQVL